MSTQKCQVIVIGSGPGGYVAAIHAAQLGLKTICIEKMASVGGTCLNVGCIPSKALLQSSEYYELFSKNAKEHGIESQGISFDFSQMMLRKERVVKGLVDGVASLLKGNGVERVYGEARFTGPNSIEVVAKDEVKTFEADNIIIATGSESIGLPFLPFDEKMIVSSTGALSLSEIPKRMVVIGAGVIGLELASVYNRLGSKVTIVEMLDRITPTMDVAVSKQLQQILKKQGLDFYLDAKVTHALKNKKEVALSVEQGGKPLEFTGDVILVAVGRRPYTKGLNLEAAGVNISTKGFITIDENFRTSRSNIFAIGDVVDGPMLAHKASYEAIAVAEIIAGRHPQVNYMSIPNVIYTHPEVASVGFTEDEAKELGLKIRIGTAFFRANPRARCSSDTEGFVKIIGDEVSGRLLGMHIIGPHASEIISEGMMAMEKKATLEDIARAPHAHPTFSETIMEAAQNALHK